MSKQQNSNVEIEVKKNDKPTIILNSNGEYVGANQKGLECHGYDRDEFIGLNCNNTVGQEKIEAGIFLERIINGKYVETDLHIIRKDGSSYTAEVVGIPIEVDGEKYAKVVIHNTEEKPKNEIDKQVDESTFAEINEAELEQIVQNIRVDAPSGEMPLNAIMFDLAVGHNELEKYKEGSLSLYNAIDERLQEEQEINPNSKDCDVLREVKKTAFGLYLRLQRGDEELHGNRDGQYSGYFN